MDGSTARWRQQATPPACHSMTRCQLYCPHRRRRRSAAQHTWQQLLAGVRAQQAATRGAPAQPLRTQRSLSAPGLGAFEAAVDIENGGITAATTGAGEQQHAALQPPPAGLATRPAADAGLLREGGAVERAVAEDLASTSAKSSQHGAGAVQDAVPEVSTACCLRVESVMMHVSVVPDQGGISLSLNAVGHSWLQAARRAAFSSREFFSC